MKRVINSNPRSEEYDEYLYNHIRGVKMAWEQILYPSIMEDMDTLGLIIDDISDIEESVNSHDDSKYKSDEYNAYCNYFYPCEGFEKDEEAFDKAWLLHQHRNPHHWQYWLLVRDEGNLEAMDMPICYICEMLCDWHSFSLRDPESTAYSWYQSNKDNMIFSDTTRDMVSRLVEYFKEPLVDK